MEFDENDQEINDRIRKLTEELHSHSARETIGMNVVRMLGSYLQEGEEMPKDLALSIGGCLEEFVDVEGKCSDEDIQVLYDEIVKLMER